MLPNVSATPGGIPAGAGLLAEKIRELVVLFLLVLAFGIGLRIWLYATTISPSGIFHQLRSRNNLPPETGWFSMPANGRRQHQPLHSFLLGLGPAPAWACRSWRALRLVFDIISFFFDVEHFPADRLPPHTLLQVIALAVIFLCPFCFGTRPAVWRRLCI